MDEPQQDEPINDPVENARAYQSALRAMQYMQSGQFGSHAEGAVAGKPEATAAAPRKSRLEQIIDNAVEKIVGGVTREVRSMAPEGRPVYRGDAVEFMRAGPPGEPELPQMEASAPSQPEMPEPFAAEMNLFRAMPPLESQTPDPVQATDPAPQPVTLERNEWPQPQRRLEAPLPPDGVMRSPAVDVSKIPDRPLAGMVSGSGAMEPPRITAEEAGFEPAEPIRMETQSGAYPDRKAHAEFREPDYEQIVGREQMMQGADVVSDFAMTTGLFMEMVFEHLRGLTEKTNQLVIAIDRLTEDSDQ